MHTLYFYFIYVILKISVGFSAIVSYKERKVVLA
uniref:Uncharacterized protein n=1 Tax=Arundo donax TaxID=35708 RepID=A0A0A9DG08_ARUDO